jgi:predicted molibdopterin-dependent oxidoreductase YjgC
MNDVVPEQVVVSTGSKQSLFNSCFVLFGQGDDVLVPTPAWTSYYQMLTLARAGAVIVLGTTLPDVARVAQVVLPVTNMAEEEGTFTNLRGRVQRFMQAKAPPGMARPVWWALGDLLAAAGEGRGYFLAGDVFATLAAARAEFAGMTYDTLGLKGAVLAGAGEATGAAR